MSYSTPNKPVQLIRILYFTMTIVLSVVEKWPQYVNFACPILVNYRYGTVPVQAYFVLFRPIVEKLR